MARILDYTRAFWPRRDARITQATTAIDSGERRLEFHGSGSGPPVAERSS